MKQKKHSLQKKEYPNSERDGKRQGIMSFLNLENKNIVLFGMANKKSVACHTARVLAQEKANLIHVVHTHDTATEETAVYLNVEGQPFDDVPAIEDIVAATMLPAARVQDALRYALSRGYVEVTDRHYRIGWNWFRAVTSFLERRRLLVGRT